MLLSSEMLVTDQSVAVPVSPQQLLPMSPTQLETEWMNSLITASIGQTTPRQTSSYSLALQPGIKQPMTNGGCNQEDTSTYIKRLID